MPRPPRSPHVRRSRSAAPHPQARHPPEPGAAGRATASSAPGRTGAGPGAATAAGRIRRRRAAAARRSASHRNRCSKVLKIHGRAPTRTRHGLTFLRFLDRSHLSSRADPVRRRAQVLRQPERRRTPARLGRRRRRRRRGRQHEVHRRRVSSSSTAGAASRTVSSLPWLGTSITVSSASSSEGRSRWCRRRCRLVLRSLRRSAASRRWFSSASGRSCRRLAGVGRHMTSPGRRRIT